MSVLLLTKAGVPSWLHSVPKSSSYWNSGVLDSVWSCLANSISSVNRTEQPKSFGHSYIIAQNIYLNHTSPGLSFKPTGHSTAFQGLVKQFFKDIMDNTVNPRDTVPAINPTESAQVITADNESTRPIYSPPSSWVDAEVSTVNTLLTLSLDRQGNIVPRVHDSLEDYMASSGVVIGQEAEPENNDGSDKDSDHSRKNQDNSEDDNDHSDDDEQGSDDDDNSDEDNSDDEDEWSEDENDRSDDEDDWCDEEDNSDDEHKPENIQEVLNSPVWQAIRMMGINIQLASPQQFDQLLAKPDVFDRKEAEGTEAPASVDTHEAQGSDIPETSKD